VWRPDLAGAWKRAWRPDPDGGKEWLACGGTTGYGGDVRWRMAAAIEGGTKTSERSAGT
jgi:hypothetical protein